MTSDYISLTNCTVVTVDSDNKYFKNGTIVIKGNKIEDIGAADDVQAKGTIIDLTGKLVMPGLINTHTHTPATMFRGIGDDMFLEPWLKERMWPAEAHLTSDLAYLASRLGYWELLQNGVTTNLDMWGFAKSVAKAVQEIGCRSVVGHGLTTGSAEQSPSSFDFLVDFLEDFVGREADTRVYPCVAPHDAYTCSREVLKRASSIAHKYEVMMHIHLSETLDAHNSIKQKEGVTSAQYMYECGVFDHNLVAAHCIHLEESDMELFKEHNVSISYNPVSNLKLCSGILPLRKVFDYEINVTLGVDGAQSNNSLDLLADMKIGSLIQKMNENDPTFLPAEQSVRMITINGAKALGMGDQIGSLEVGKSADIIALNLDDCNLTPIYNSVEHLYSHIIYSADGRNVTDVWVDGEQLVENRNHLRADEENIIRSAQIATEELSKNIF